MSNPKSKKAVAVVTSLSMMANASPQINAIDQIVIPQNNNSIVIPSINSIIQNNSTDFSMKSIESKISNVLNPDRKAKKNNVNRKLKESSISGSCGTNVNYSLNIDTGVLTISGSGKMEDYSASNGPSWSYVENEINSVIIENGVTSIGSYAFSNCYDLTSVTIPDSVTSIGSYAFSNCYDLTSVTILDSVTSIGESAFRSCKGLTSITIPDSITSISDNAFTSCSGLTSITIPDSVTSIGKEAFQGCKGLTSITIPDSVTEIGYCAFFSCSAMTSISVNSSNRNYKSIDGILFSKDGNTLIQCPAGKTGEVTIPSSVTSIGSDVFAYCSGLTSITIPDSVTSISDDAFRNCTGLTQVTIPNSVTSIGKYAFNYCTGLTQVTIGNGVTSIGNGVFSNCSGLTQVSYLGKNDPGVSSSYVFYNCSEISSVLVPYDYASDTFCGKEISRMSATDSGSCGTGVNYTFSDFTGELKIYGSGAMNDYSYTSDIPWYSYSTSIKSVKIENGVTSIGGGAFFGCSGLTSITIPDSVTKIGEGAISDCSGLTSITIPASVTSIGDYAFSGCSGLTSITIPASVTEIGMGAFAACSGLTSITIPDSVTKIGDYAFTVCSGLASITIPASVTSIGSEAFKCCSELTQVTYLGKNDPGASSSDVFAVCSKMSSVLVPYDYASDTFCGKEISRMPEPTISGSCGTNVNYSLNTDTGVLTVSGSGAMNNYNNCNTIPWYSYRTSIKSVIIENGVTSIGDYAFSDCSGLTSITIPASVTKIGEGAISSCSGLTSITIPDKVTEIGSYAFSGCSGLTSITIPASVTEIGMGAFAACFGLTSINVDENNSSFKSIDGILYSKDGTSLILCSGGKTGSITIPASVTEIGMGAFFGCSGLTSITIPASVTKIGEGAFTYCSGLTQVTYLGKNDPGASSSDVFAECSKISSVLVPYDYASDTFCGKEISRMSATTTEESTIEESTTKESTIEESTTEESTTKESTTEESTTKESTTEESKTKSNEGKSSKTAIIASTVSVAVAVVIAAVTAITCYFKNRTTDSQTNDSDNILV